MNSTEVWGFSIARDIGRQQSGVAAIVFCWLAVSVVAAVAVWGGSLLLGCFAGVLLAIAVTWTVAKLRVRLQARRIQRRAALDQRGRDA